MKTKTLLITICCLATFVGCKKQLDEGIAPPLQLNTSLSVSNPKNPYSVTNMRKAFANLLIADVQLIKNNAIKFTKGKVMFTEGNQTLSINKQLNTTQGIAIAQSGINTTHYYIKFIPRNDADYSLLKKDSNLVIYPFPLDNEITSYSGSYRDPSVAPGVPTFQYAAVPIGYQLPNVPYQKLEDLYLPNENDRNASVKVIGDGGSSYTVSARQLVSQALCDGNEPQEPPTASKVPEKNNIVKSSSYKPPVVSLVPPVDDDPCEGGGGGGGPYPPNDPYRNGENWRPNGRITLYDDTKQQTIGVEGIKVRAYRWFTTYTGITDSNGYYAVDGWFTRPANYWLDFERYDFSVNNGGGGPQEISGPKQEVAWNLDLTDYNRFCGNIFRAAFHYYYKDVQGLRRPPQNSFWATQLKLGAYNQVNTTADGDHSPWRRLWGIGEAIHIYNPDRSADRIYSTTIHELAHAVHWDMDGNGYRNSNTNVSESWSVGVQWVLTKMEYPNYLGRLNGTPNYTNIVMDLIDAPGQEFFNHGTFAPIDSVQGYNIVEIQNSLVGVWNLEAWKNNLFYQYENTTENNLDPLFTYWGNN